MARHLPPYPPKSDQTLRHLRSQPHHPGRDFARSRAARLAAQRATAGEVLSPKARAAQPLSAGKSIARALPAPTILVVDLAIFALVVLLLRWF